MQVLGETLAEIALTKGKEIIKPNVPVVAGRMPNESSSS